MVSIKVGGTEYVLRFDMDVLEAIEDMHGGLKEAVEKMRKIGKAKELIADIFCLMVNSAVDYRGKGTYMNPDNAAQTLFPKHCSIGRVKACEAAILQAIQDGNRMQTADEEDDKVRGTYLEDLNKQENEKN